MSWRAEAKAALRLYPRALKRRATPGAALTQRERRALAAVDFTLRMQRIYPNAEERLRMIRLVYFQRSCTLEGAAQHCHYSRSTVQQWDTEILTAAYVALQYERCASGGPGTDPAAGAGIDPSGVRLA